MVKRFYVISLEPAMWFP